MNEQPILTFIEAHYPLRSIAMLERLATNGQRQALLLQADQGWFVLKISDPGRAEETVRCDTGILAYLEKCEFPAPRLLRALDGQDYLPYGDHFLHLYGYLEGRHPLPGPAFMAKAGRLMARLHSLPVSDCRQESRYTPAAIVDEVRGYLERALQTDQRRQAEGLLERLERLPSFDGLPPGIIHTDPYLFNWLEDGQGSLSLIDWDDGGVGVSLLDTGYLLANLTTYPRHEARRWGVPETGQITWREDWCRQLLAAYESVRPLTRLERQLLPAAMQLSVLAYVWDWGSQRLIEDNIVRLEIVEQFRL